MFYDIGNPLLASQGKQVEEFIGLLYDRLLEAGGDDDFDFVNPVKEAESEKATLLEQIQQEILDLQYQGTIASLETGYRGLTPENFAKSEKST